MWRYYSILTWRVWQDGGHGITNKSLRYFDSLKGKLGQIQMIHIDEARHMSMEIVSMNGVALFSGLGCGYGGVGPTGTLAMFKLLGINNDVTKSLVINDRSVSITRDMVEFGSW